jgi:hypothetical protein
MEPRALSAAVLALCVALGTLSGCGKSPDTATPSTKVQTNTATAAAPQATFATPDEAVAALIAAGEKQDDQALQRLLGPGTKDLLSSGDPVEDRRAREAFRERYRAYHELVAGSPNDLVLLVGEDRWPLPIPLIRRDGRWSWDGAAGARELVMRRIGANELQTLDVMRGFVEAERDYAAEGHDGDKRGVYAQKLRSSPGKHDGLYWEVPAGGRPSPAGPLLAAANSEGYAGGGGDTPYHGYLFKILTLQGPEANGGARSYIVDGKLTGGFALLGYPASYRVSGVMTFLVNQDGVVWQRDLGPDTATAAAAIAEFNPDDAWTPLAREG